MRLIEVENRLKREHPGLEEAELRLYLGGVGPGGRQGRSLRERQSVMSLMCEAFGEEARLGHKENGAPVAEGVDAEISVSHTSTAQGEGWAALAVVAHGWRVGVDVECLGRGAQLTRVQNRFLTPEEAEWCQTDEALTRAWTMKEAIYKALQIDGLELSGIPLPKGSEVMAAGVEMMATTLLIAENGPILSVAVAKKE